MTPQQVNEIIKQLTRIANALERATAKPVAALELENRRFRNRGEAGL